MTRETLLAEILQLSPEERLALLGDVWDSIAACSEAVPVPEWHRRELDRRLSEPAPEYIPWPELRKRFEDGR